MFPTNQKVYCMQIIMTRDDFQVALSAIQLVAKGMATISTKNFGKDVEELTVDQLLARKIEDDGLVHIEHSEHGVVLTMSHEALQKVYDTYHLYDLGVIIGHGCIVGKMAFEYADKVKTSALGLAKYVKRNK